MCVLLLAASGLVGAYFPNFERLFLARYNVVATYLGHRCVAESKKKGKLGSCSSATNRNQHESGAAEHAGLRTSVYGLLVRLSMSAAGCCTAMLPKDATITYTKEMAVKIFYTSPQK